MGKQMNIGDRKEHIGVIELLDVITSNTKNATDKNSVYQLIKDIIQIDNEKEPTALTLIVNDREAVAFTNSDPLSMQMLDFNLTCYRRTKMFAIEYSLDCQEDWTITRLANHLTTQY